MKGLAVVLSSLVLYCEVVSAGSIPQNVQNFYNRVKAEQSCTNILQAGLRDKDGGPSTFNYCQDPTSKVVYIHGSNFELANMDVDCDGLQGGAGDDGRCLVSKDTQTDTAFQDIVQSYNKSIPNLNAHVHPYVVFGNDGTKPNFKPKKYQIEPLSIIAVACNNQLLYGFWGDTNGDTPPMVGEASIALATACFGVKGIDGNHGYNKEDVLYIAFPGVTAVPGKLGANWGAQSYEDFESSIQALGDSLVAGL